MEARQTTWPARGEAAHPGGPVAGDVSVNAELIRLYWDIGRLIAARQQREGWGAAVIPRLSAELCNDLPELKGFSERKIGQMIAFYRAYPDPLDFSQQAAAKIELALKVPHPGGTNR